MAGGVPHEQTSIAAEDQKQSQNIQIVYPCIAHSLLQIWDMCLCKAILSLDHTWKSQCSIKLKAEESCSP